MLELMMTIYAILLLIYMIHVIYKVTKLRREDREMWNIARELKIVEELNK